MLAGQVARADPHRIEPWVDGPRSMVDVFSVMSFLNCSLCSCGLSECYKTEETNSKYC